MLCRSETGEPIEAPFVRPTLASDETAKAALSGRSPSWSPPRKRTAQEDYQRPTLVAEEPYMQVECRTQHTNKDTVPFRPLSHRMIEQAKSGVDDAMWGMSRALIADPSRIDDPEITEAAKKEMLLFNARSLTSGTKSGQLENGLPIAALFSAFNSSQEMGITGLDPFSIVRPNAPLDPVQPNWAATAAGAFARIKGLIQSNYSATSRPALKTAVRHWGRFCAKLGISPFRPQVANNWEAKVQEEMILMLFLDYLPFEVGVQGSTCEGYFSLMKGWHGEEMGYQPSASGIFTTVWISKLLRGARRNFPSRFAEREAHSMVYFKRFRREYAHWLMMKEFFVPHEEITAEGKVMLRLFLESIDWFDFLAEVVLEAMVACLLRIGEALPTKLMPMKLCRDDVKFVYKDGKLFEVVMRIYPLKQSVRARKAGRKIPTCIPANAGPFLMAAELLWLMIAADPAEGDLRSVPLFRKAAQLSVSNSRSLPRGNAQVTHNWLLKQYRRKLQDSGMDSVRVVLFKLHSPRIIGATTLFASGKVTDMHLKSKGRWAGDIAFIYARFCPDMDRDAVRAMGCTDATPFMESSDAHWASISGWTEDDRDLGDAEEFDDDDEALSDEDDEEA